MRHPSKISVLLLILLSACNFPSSGGPLPGSTVVPDAETIQATETAVPEGSYTECGFVWARQSLPDLSQEFDKALKEALPQASGYAQVYGENCINNQGEVMRFLAMETDFYVTLKVADLEDQQELGNSIEQILEVIAQFPVTETPGPQPGYVGLTFETPGDAVRLWFTQLEAQAAMDHGLRGEELYLALQQK
jgi:hypothetical protein